MIIDEREGVQDAEIPVPAEEVEQQPLSLRDTIKTAFKEVEGDEVIDREESPSEAKPPKETGDEIAQRLAKAREAKRAKAAAERVSGQAPPQTREADKRLKPDNKQTDPTNQQLPKEGKPDDGKSPVDAPPFWKSKGKQVWDGLPVAAQEAIAQREKEVSDGFAYYGPRAKAFEELAKVIEPHMPAIQRFGVTVPQTIERLFGWMQAIANPDLRARGEAFKALARNFQVDLAQLMPQDGQHIPQEQSNQPPEWFSQYHAAVNTETNQLKQAIQGIYQQQQSQAAEAAGSYLGSWAKDKPYFEAVKPQMKYLVDTGQVGLNAQGILDLDKAYEYAVANNAQIQAQMRADSEAKAQAEAAEAAQKKAKETAARLNRARNAGSSLRPSPPMTVTQPMARRPNGVAGRASVRDSLLQSMRELSTE